MLRIFERKKGILRKGSLNEIDSGNISWLNCYSPTEEELSRISKKIRISEDRLLHFLDEDARPHLLNTREFSLILLGILSIEEGRLKKDLVSIFLLPNNNILTLSRNEVAIVRKFEELILKNQELIKTPANFVYNLADEIITQSFAIIDSLGEQIDVIEDEVVKKPERGIVGKIFLLKRGLILLHKTIIANREVVTGIEKGYATRISGADASSFRFLYNDLVQLIDMSETYRDIATGIIEIYLSTISNMLNNTIKKMTAWGSLILIPTLIASVYGMNFQKVSEFNMPELYWQYGYPFALGLMAVSVMFLYLYFRIKRWI
jgi:magnesium transporter